VYLQEDCMSFNPKLAKIHDTTPTTKYLKIIKGRNPKRSEHQMNQSKQKKSPEKRVKSSDPLKNEKEPYIGKKIRTLDLKKMAETPNQLKVKKIFSQKKVSVALQKQKESKISYRSYSTEFFPGIPKTIYNSKMRSH
jgi:hypothetical protein